MTPDRISGSLSYNCVSQELYSGASYPGKSAKFICIYGHWMAYVRGEHLRLQSETADSLIKGLVLSDFQDGSASIEIYFSPEKLQTIEAYLQSSGVDTARLRTDHHSYFRITDPKERKIVIQMLKTHNEFPERLLGMIHQVFEKGDETIAMSPLSSQDQTHPSAAE